MMANKFTNYLPQLYRNISATHQTCSSRYHPGKFQQYYTTTNIIPISSDVQTETHYFKGEKNDKNNDYSDKRSNHFLKPVIPVMSVVAVVLGYAVGQKCKSSCSVNERETDTICNEESKFADRLTLREAIDVSRDLCQRVKDETGCPGLVIAVSVDGKQIWSDGFGFVDIENRAKCTTDAVMRIASISKPITMAVVAKLWEQDKLDLDKAVNHYVPTWPQKTYKGEKVTITTRQLVSHISGIRHYDKNCGRKSSKDDKNKNNTKKVDKNASEQKETKTDSGEHEFYIKQRYNSVTDALELFKNDELCFLPGTDYLYTTHGWTLVSAVVEGAANKKFPEIMKQLFKDLGMDHTYFDENEPIIYGRARHYVKNKRGCIVNTPYVDLSCKWAGGGFLSTVADLNKFGNAMLYSYQLQTAEQHSSTPGYLKSKTINMLWSPEKRAKCDWDTDGYYGMGWGVVIPGAQKYGQCREVREYFSHTGGAVGATSALIILPRKPRRSVEQTVDGLPQGVVVSIIANLGSCSGLTKTAIKVAKLFENVEL